LGRSLQRQDRLDQAVNELQTCHDIGAKDPRWNLPSREWLEECQALIDERDGDS
jgi:hypothetical protein